MKKTMTILILLALTSALGFAQSASQTLFVGGYDITTTNIGASDLALWSKSFTGKTDTTIYKFARPGRTPFSKLVYVHFVGETNGLFVDEVYGNQTELEKLYAELKDSSADFKVFERTIYKVPSLIIIVKTQDLLPKLWQDKDLRAQVQAFMDRN